MSAFAFGLHCSALTTFDGYVGSAPTSAGVDASETGSSADGAVGDGSGPVDAAMVDAGAQDADAGGFCQRQSPSPRFCDDFDEDDGGFSRWTEIVTANGATVTRDVAAFRSAPASLLSTSPGGNGSGAAYLKLKPQGTVKHVRFSFDLRIDTRDTQTGYAEIAYIKLSTGSDFYVSVVTDPRKNGYTAESFPDGSALRHTADLPASLSFDDWHRVTIDVDVGSLHVLTVSVDGVMAFVQPLEASLYTPGIVEVNPGIGYTGSPSGLWKMRFDNVTADWE